MPTTTHDLLDGIRRWVEIETHTPDVDGINALMTHVAEGFSAAGGRVSRIPGRNQPGLDRHGDHLAIATPWGGNRPGVLVLCHLDTVHPKGTLTNDLPFRIDGDRAYGPGIYDMKGGAYCAFAAFREILASGRETALPIRLLFTSDEEVGSPTSRQLIEDYGANAKYVLVTEGARDGGQIVVGRKGVGRYVLTAHGRPAHAGARHSQGRSAIVEIARHIVAIEGLTDYARGLTFNVGQVFGGTADNVVPAKAVAHIDMRVASVADGVAMDQYFQALRAYNPDVRLQIEGGINRPPYEKNAGVAQLFEHARGLAAELGIDLIGQSTGGASDGNFTAHTVPTLDGLGVDGAGAHTLEEYMLVSSAMPRMTLQKRLMETLV
jgi:glutamate carboxypeptidase